MPQPREKRVRKKFHRQNKQSKKEALDADKLVIERKEKGNKEILGGNTYFKIASCLNRYQFKLISQR